SSASVSASAPRERSFSRGRNPPRGRIVGSAGTAFPGGPTTSCMFRYRQERDVGLPSCAKLGDTFALPRTGRSDPRSNEHHVLGEFCMRRAIVFIVLIVCLAFVGSLPSRGATQRRMVNSIGLIDYSTGRPNFKVGDWV